MTGKQTQVVLNPRSTAFIPASQTTLEALQVAGVWRNGSVLQVYFMNDDEWSHGRHLVSHLIQSSWERFANIKFDFFNNNTEADIRIKLNETGSYTQGLGSNCLRVNDVNTETMGLAINPRDLTWCSKDDPNVRRPILHEFAHALSLCHEHQRPCFPGELDLAAIRYLKSIDEAEWKHEMHGNYLPHTNPRCVCSLDVFGYDGDSIMHYRFEPGETKTSLVAGVDNEPSAKDIALMAYLYPKPCGGTIELNWTEGYLREGNGRQDFLAVRKSIPRIVAGLTSLLCLSNVHMSLRGEATKADEAGFSHYYEESPTSDGSATTAQTGLSYLAIDPHIEEIYVGEPVRFPGPLESSTSTRTAISDSATRWLKARATRGLKFVSWITGIAFDGAHGDQGTVFASTSAPDGLAATITGNISEVTYNWLAYSNSAINIHSGQLEPTVSQQDLKAVSLIAVPKSIFPERPQILLGISSISFNALAVRCRVSLHANRGENAEEWLFWQQVETIPIYVCNVPRKCDLRLQTTWVAVSAGHGLLQRPMTKAEMREIEENLKNGDENVETELEEVGKMSKEDLEEYWNKKKEKNSLGIGAPTPAVTSPQH